MNPSNHRQSVRRFDLAETMEEKKHVLKGSQAWHEEDDL